MSGAQSGSRRTLWIAELNSALFEPRKVLSADCKSAFQIVSVDRF